MSIFRNTTTTLDLIRRSGHLTLGIKLPLDNDWSPEGEARRIADGRPHGVADLSCYPALVRQIDAFGFAAIWMRDVPLFDPQNIGDAGSINDPFVHLGFLAGFTKHVALGTASIVFPLRHPMMVAKAAAFVDCLSGGRLILGLASDDRPVEYSLLGLGFEARGKTFLNHLEQLRCAEADQIAMLLRSSRRPLPDVVDELPQYVLPVLAHSARKASL